MEKPINLRTVDLENDIVKLMNESNLPGFILRPIIDRIYNQVIDLEKMQYDNTLKEYENALKDEDLKKKGEKKNGTK